MQKYVTLRDGGPYAGLKLFAYYMQRLCTSRRFRQVAARITVTGLKLVHGRPPRQDLLDLASVDAMRMQGFVHPRRLLSSEQCADMLAYLRKQTMIDVRGNGARFDMESVRADTAVADYPLETVANCPHVVELANHPEVLAIAAGYLGYTPTITLMSMRWSFARATPDVDVQSFHRDAEAGCVKLLVYLTDVDEDYGPHRYVAGSHRDRVPIRLQRYSECGVNARYGGSIPMLGPAGTAFVIDCKGIHKGSPPKRGARLLLGIQYSLVPSPLYRYAPVHYAGRAKFKRYINRLMITTGPARGIRLVQEEAMAPVAK